MLKAHPAPTTQPRPKRVMKSNQRSIYPLGSVSSNVDLEQVKLGHENYSGKWKHIGLYQLWEGESGPVPMWWKHKLDGFH